MLFAHTLLLAVLAVYIIRIIGVVSTVMFTPEFDNVEITIFIFAILEAVTNSHSKLPFIYFIFYHHRCIDKLVGYSISI